MKISEIKNMTPDELNEKLADSIKELRQLKFNHSVQSIENPLQIKVLRRQIARMKTIINEKKED
ncbi:MAG: 50S ribosomal protein L29 [Flavobacteriaceae bacterium]|jgi:ribosomal protein L29|nr:50S ribosomal protein L29 [Flavobacteriaceae bacterium]|tara:strand:- start:132 stop:323 length:192 start_codon:yes stop_codon:yes gene_type:complete